MAAFEYEFKGHIPPSPMTRGAEYYRQSWEKIIRIASVLGIIYMAPCDCTALDFSKTTSDVTLEQQIQTRHPSEFPQNGKFKGFVLCGIILYNI